MTEQEKLEADAKRYRWIKANLRQFGFNSLIIDGPRFAPRAGFRFNQDQLDEIVDIAIACEESLERLND